MIRTNERESQAHLDSLAAKLRRPAGALRELARLAPEQLAELERTIDGACQRQRAQVWQALRRAMPQPLRMLILAGLGKESS